MLRKLVLVFLLLNAILLNPSLAADADTSTENPVIIKTTTTEKPDTTTAPTTVPTTTEKTTTSTTTASTTTTAKPSNTTTATPTTPTTTVAPTPAPPKPWPQNIGNWSVSSEQENVTCILFRAALLINVPYKVGNETKVAHVEVPYNAAATGECEEIAQTITLSWKDGNISFTFVYNSNGTATVDSVGPNKFALQNVAGVVYVNESATAEGELTKVDFNIEKLDTYQTSANKSFKCESEQTLKNKDGEVQLKLAHAQVEAFRAKFDHSFGPAVECELDGAVADIVPIAVGASLAGLVVIVLIAYLIGRRRSRARGYQSV